MEFFFLDLFHKEDFLIKRRIASCVRKSGWARFSSPPFSTLGHTFWPKSIFIAQNDNLNSQAQFIVILGLKLWAQNDDLNY